MSDLKDSLMQWRYLVEAQVDFLRAVGEYRLDAAKAELVAAVASNQLSVARMKAQIAQELGGALRRLHRFENRNKLRAQRLATMARDASLVMNGEDLSLTRMVRMWSAYKVFERMLPLESLEKIMENDLAPGSRAADQFVNKADPQSECEDVPDTVDNEHMLVGWIKRKRYLAKRGTRAYRHIVHVFYEIAEVGRREVEKVERSIDEMREGTFKVWNPLIISALPDSLDGQKILSAGIKSL